MIVYRANSYGYEPMPIEENCSDFGDNIYADKKDAYDAIIERVEVKCVVLLEEITDLSKDLDARRNRLVEMHRSCSILRLKRDGKI